MAGQGHATTALLTEHFRQTPLSLLDEIINTVNELVFKAVDRLEEALSNAPADVLGYTLSNERAANLDESAHEAALADVKQKEVDIGIMQLESLLNAIVDKDFDKFEIYTLRNILAVGHEEDIDLTRWIRLDHYRDLQIQPQGQQTTPETVQLQRRKRYETAKVNLMLKEEQVRDAATLEQLHSMLDSGSSPLSLIAAAASHPSSYQATQDMSQIMAQLPTIRRCLADLKTSLAQPVSDRRFDGESSAVKRREYLRQQSLQALELRGLAVGPADQFTTSRRLVNKDQVEGLEAVVQALGGAQNPPD